MARRLVAGATALVASLPLAAGAQPAAAPNPPAPAQTCEALASDIATRIRANGVTNFELEIVPAKLAEGERVVGSCDRGRRRIIYIRP